MTVFSLHVGYISYLRLRTGYLLPQREGLLSWRPLWRDAVPVKCEDLGLDERRGHLTCPCFFHVKRSGRLPKYTVSMCTAPQSALNGQHSFGHV